MMVKITSGKSLMGLVRLFYFLNLCFLRTNEAFKTDNSVWVVTKDKDAELDKSCETSKAHLSNFGSCSKPLLPEAVLTSSKASLNTDPSLVLFVYMFLCHWCGFSTPEQAQGVSRRKVSVVLLPLHHPMCLLCMCVHACICMCAHRISRIHYPLKALHIYICMTLQFMTHTVHACSIESPFHLTHKGFCFVVYRQAYLQLIWNSLSPLVCCCLHVGLQAAAVLDFVGFL